MFPTSKLSRRSLLQGGAALGASSALLGGLTPAFSQSATVDEEALMVAGPLGDKTLGPADAPVTVVEYASMTCGHCASWHNNTYKPFKEKYVDTGQVHFVFREFPLDPVATAVFMLARCLPEERYFPAIDVFFETQNQWARAENVVVELQKLALQLGFTQESFKECLTNQEVLDGVNWVRKRGAEEFQVASTPTFFINGRRETGAMNLEQMDAVIEPLL